MPTAGDRSPSTPLSGRRLIQRIASPFASKARNLTDYCIEIDHPHKQFSPGDTVSGCVKLRVTKPIRVTHLVVCLHGYVQVYKNPNSPPADGYRANGSYIGTGRGSKAGEYFGNGFASLFEDEVVLCGDGRLAEGLYQFNFNLEFPDRDLPSSISFERGRISYLVTATLTRPTAISPTLQCDHKVFLVERIDISRFLPPKSRTITLEAISRRHRAKAHARKLTETPDRQSRTGDSTRRSGERRGSRSSSSPSVQVDDAAITSASPSEVSFESGASAPGQLGSSTGSPRQSDASHSNSTLSAPVKTITATVESLSGGCLRGDAIPIRVTVNHTKYVKSLYGVIITLYRSARVDMHPAIPLGPTEKGKEAKYEDYYPKSLSGLGGLSLSGAGSSHVFRKDLTQVMLPLIINPGSLTAEVNGRVHVPEEAFPTISTVPGAMISFRYYVEVVVDIQGKLSSQDRNMSNLGGLTSTIGRGTGTEGMDGERSAFNPFGSPIIDTTPIRRDKGVVACTFEVIVGTKDSERHKGKRKAEPVTAEPQAQTPQAPEMPQTQQPQNSTSTQNSSSPPPPTAWDDAPVVHDYGYQWYDPNYHGYQDYSGYYPHDGAYQNYPPVPMPQIEDESQLPEKERLRRAEARLLPSQPPGADSGPSGEGSSSQPTAPYLPEEQFEASGEVPHATPLLLPPTVDPAHQSWTAVAADVRLPRTPEYEPPDPTVRHCAAAVPGATDDKRELQRRHLEMEASAPPLDDEPGPSAATAAPGPSAPVLSDDDELYADHDGHADGAAGGYLPRYER